MNVLYYRRQGECNRCGNCCENSPWPLSWPGSMRTWRPEDVAKNWPHAKLVPLPAHGGPVRGAAVSEGEEFPYEWVDSQSLCKSKINHDCPFLRGVKGDETRPCALVDTSNHYMWNGFCRKLPPEIMKGEEKVADWFRNNPDCSYEFVEEQVEIPDRDS